MLSIPIPKSCLQILVDDCDAARVIKHAWKLQRADQNEERFYVYTTIKGRKIYLHHFILENHAEVTVDHRNGDGLDNRRENLRLASRSQNNANRSVRNSTGYRGVARDRKKFRAFISDPSREKRKSIHLGSFDSPEAAARAYDQAALKRWGEFARLNFEEAA